ncbi:hypothetical protein ACP70R_042449 [Stipagrostis hirtigluma subsp. patula]
MCVSLDSSTARRLSASPHPPSSTFPPSRGEAAARGLAPAAHAHGLLPLASP